MKKLWLLSVFILLVSACQKQTATDVAPVTVVLDWTVNTNHTGLYVALDKGYFTDEGLGVAIQSPPQNGALSLVLSGKAEFAVSYQEEITHARARGVPVKGVAAIIQHNTSVFASRKKAGIISPSDFEGRRYGGWGSPMEEAMIRGLMKKDGGDFSKVDMISIGDMDFFAATEKNIDFVWIFKGWDGIQAELKGIPLNYITPGEIEQALDYYTPLIAAEESYLKENKAQAKLFLKALSRGYEFAINNPGKAAEILLSHAPELDKNLVYASQKYLAPEYKADASRWGEMKEPVWTRFAEWMKSYGLLEGDFAASDAFTNEFLP